MATRARFLPCPRNFWKDSASTWSVMEFCCHWWICSRNSFGSVWQKPSQPKSQCCWHKEQHLVPSGYVVSLPVNDKGLAKPVHCPVLHCPLCFGVPGVQGEDFGVSPVGTLSAVRVCFLVYPWLKEMSLWLCLFLPLSCSGCTNLPKMVVWIMLFFSPSSPHIYSDVFLFSSS